MTLPQRDNGWREVRELIVGRSVLLKHEWGTL